MLAFWVGSLFFLLLTETTGLTLSLHKGQDVALTDGADDVADDRAVGLVEELNADLGALTTRASAAENLLDFSKLLGKKSEHSLSFLSQFRFDVHFQETEIVQAPSPATAATHTRTVPPGRVLHARSFLFLFFFFFPPIPFLVDTCNCKKKKPALGPRASKIRARSRMLPPPHPRPYSHCSNCLVLVP